MKHVQYILKVSVGLLVVAMLLSSRPVDWTEIIRIKFNQYYSNHRTSKLHLSFNQPFYAVGDTIFFSALHLNENNQRILSNEIATLDLLDFAGKLRQRILFKIKQGFDTNQLVIPDSIVPGLYTLVCYTDDLKEEGLGLCYRKDINIVGPGSSSASPISSTVQLFAEGGKLISNVDNNLTVLAKSKPGNLYLIDQHHVADTHRISINKAGIGRIQLRPLKNSVYRIWGNDLKPMPIEHQPIVDDGIAIQLTKSIKSSFEFLLEVNQQSSLVGKKLAAVVTSMGKIVLVRQILFDASGKKALSFNLTENFHQLHQLHLIDDTGNLIAQRVFIPESKLSMLLSVNQDSVLHHRKLYSFPVSLKDYNENLLRSAMSITIFQSDLFGRHSKNGSGVNLIDIPGAQLWFEDVANPSNEQINDFLVSTSWNRIDWSKIFEENGKDRVHPVKEKPLFRAKVVRSSDGSEAPDSLLVLAFLQKNVLGFEAYTKNGTIEVPFTFDVWENDDLFVTTLYKGKNADNDFMIIPQVDSLSSYVSKSRVSSNKESTENIYGKYQYYKNMTDKSFSFYHNDRSKSVESSQSVNDRLIEEFRGIDYSVRVDDYLIFQTVEELLREIMPFVKAKNKNDSYVVRISYRHETNSKTFKGDPLYVIDGVMTKNTSLFMSLQPEDIVSLSLINSPNKLSALGKFGENGILFIETKNARYDKTSLNKNHFQVIGLSPAINKSIGAGSLLPKDFPDLRANLYWNGFLSTNTSSINTVTFGASDDIGPMKMLIDGITESGIPFYFEHHFKVIYKK